MAEQRTKRDAESREVETRPSDSWLPASVLPNPCSARRMGVSVHTHQHIGPRG